MKTDMAIEKSPFQNTEFDFLSQNWIIKKVAEVFDVKQGKQLSSKEATEGKTKRPFLRTSNVLWGKIDISKIDYMYFTDEEFNNLRLQKGDILLCEGGDIGRTAIWNDEIDECAYQNHLHRLRIKPFQDFDNYFFYYWMKFAIAQRKLYIYQGNVTTIPNLSSSRLKNFEIPSPPIQEQNKIAGVLRVVQEAKEKTEETIKATKELKKSLMKHLFTYGPVPSEEAEKVKLKETEIGHIPNTWDLKRCEEICTKITVGIVVKPASYYVKRGIPALRSLNIKEDRISLNDLVYVSEKDNDTVLKKSKLLSNDVLIVRTGYPGTSCVVSQELEGANCIDIAIARPKKDVMISEFLSRFFNSNSGRKQTLASLTGLAQKHLNISSIKNAFIPVPSLSIQRSVANILEAIDKKIMSEENKKKALEELFKTLLNNLMTGKIRVHDLDIEV